MLRYMQGKVDVTLHAGKGRCYDTCWERSMLPYMLGKVHVTLRNKQHVLCSCFTEGYEEARLSMFVW